MTFTRRDVNRLLVVGAAAAALSPTPALGQSPPIRLPLKEFVADPRMLSALRKGVTAMKARKPSDPLSWFYQAAIHGVTDHLWGEAAKTDPEVLNVDRTKYWNQCPHNGQNSANFLPWHRAYTHHFEEILRLHTGESDFAIPYWDYSQPDQREFPREFGVEHLDDNQQNNDPANINPLFHPDRDYYLCGYEHPFTDQLPLSELSARAVDTSRVMNSPVFFGTTESVGVGGGIADSDPSTRGLMEQAPHDQIHRTVGGIVQGTDGEGNPVTAIGAMATPPTAGFDPIFPIHHANIDRLWARWSCLPDKSWGQLPDSAWFDEKPWFFFDTAGREVNRPRRDYFDYRALGVRFKDEPSGCTPLQLPPRQVLLNAVGTGAPRRGPAMTHALDVPNAISAPATRPTAVPLVPASARNSAAFTGFNRALGTVDTAAERITVTLRDVEVGQTGANGFDVFLVVRGTTSPPSRDSAAYLGSISLFNHPSSGVMEIDQSFDVTPALVAMNRRSLDGLDLLLVPYALRTPSRVANTPLRLNEARLEASGLTVTRSARDVPLPAPPHH